MLGIKEFSKLNFEKQCTAITFKGSLLIKKDFGMHKAYLFSLGSFFVEIWFNGSKNEIHGINSFEAVRGLDMYIEDVEISEVISILNKKG